jgi:hypothetical protein
MANLSSSTGYTPLQTRIPLVNNATTNVQDFALYDAQTLTGLVYIDATTDKRAAVTVTIVRNGAGTYEVGATDIVGDDNSGLPIVSFSMSGSILQATLVSYAGFVSAYIQFHLAAPVFGANYPLTVSTTNIVGRTDGVAQSTGYIGQVLTATGAAVAGGAASTFANCTSITLTAGNWSVSGSLSINNNGATAVDTFLIAISGYSANTNTDHTTGMNVMAGRGTTSADPWSNASVPGILVRSDGTSLFLNGFTITGQTLYLKGRTSWSTASPTLYGTITAHRTA